MLKSRKKLDVRLAHALSISPKKLGGELLKEEALFIEASERFEDQQKEYEKEQKLNKNVLFSPIFYGIVNPKSKIVTKPVFDEVYLSGFIKFLGSQDDLEKLGVKVRAKSGDIFTVFAPLKVVPVLEKLKSVIFIELAKPLFPTLDESVNIAQINTLHAGGVRGNNVIVGVIDFGIDVYHPNFRNNDGLGTDGLGSSRILRIWDHFLAASGTEVVPAGFGYGVEYTQANINTELNKPAATPAYSTVRHGGFVGSHGSHVAGIAAGNGRAIGNGGEAAGTFVGAAPNANIIFVQNAVTPGIARYTDSAFTADACSYVFGQATTLGMPCVINISQSDDIGPHDGSALSQEFLDGLLNVSGRAVTVSAGNSNNNSSHASGQVLQGANQTVQLRYQLADENGDGILDAPTRPDMIEIWYDGHDRITPTITAPDGTVIGPVAFGTSSGSVPLIGGAGSVTVTNNTDPRNNDNFISILIQSTNIPVGNWQIQLAGTTIINGRFDAWVDRNNRAQSDFLAPHVTENNLTLADFATTKRFIAVGNHVKTGTQAISTSSGCGPTRDGRIKPEIAAVGNAVTSVMARNMNAVTPGNFYVDMSGTSMSAPLVAGAIALMFECRGAGLNWADIKQILADTADTTSLTIPSNAFGFGRLRMGAACTRPATDVDVWLREFVGDTGAEPAATVSWRSPDIQIFDKNHVAIPNPIYNVVGGVQEDNFVTITVNNRGTQNALNTEVYLYWADPATAIHFLDDWNAQGIYTPVGGAWTNLGNKIVIPIIAAGSSVTVEFRWLPPVPGSNLRGDNHFCLLGRVENAADASMLGIVDGWSIFAADNNIAIRNTDIQNIDVPGDAEFTFYTRGTGSKDALLIETDIPKPIYKIEMPAIAIPYRNLAFIEKLPCVHTEFTGKNNCNSEYVLDKIKIEKPEQVRKLTDIDGAKAVYINDGIATILVQGNKKVHIETLKIQDKAKMPIKITLVKKGFDNKEHNLVVTQLSDGKKIGGVVLELKQ